MNSEKRAEARLTDISDEVDILLQHGGRTVKRKKDVLRLFSRQNIVPGSDYVHFYYAIRNGDGIKTITEGMGRITKLFASLDKRNIYITVQEPVCTAGLPLRADSLSGRGRDGKILFEYKKGDTITYVLLVGEQAPMN